MKYAIIIADGGADFPIDELGGKTPFEAAHAPNLNALAKAGRVGRVVTTPPGFVAGSDVCSMCLLGYDPGVYHTGRTPLEAAALGIPLAPKDWIFRVNLITVGEDDTPDQGLLLDHSAGAISNAEARRIVEGLVEHWRLHEPALMADMTLTPGVSYRNILVDSSGNRGVERAYDQVRTTPPHEMPRWPWPEHAPTAKPGSGEPGRQAADILLRLMELARVYLPTHQVNTARIAAGKKPANMCWIWGQGLRPNLPLFKDRYGLRGAMTTAVDLLAGIAALIGWDRLDVPGVSSYHDNDYAGQGRATCEALGEYDIVCCHVESPDEASHQGDFKTKVAALEAIDKHIVGPVTERLSRFGDPEKDGSSGGWRLLFMPDHFTLVSTRKHDATPSPFLMAGAWIRSAVQRPYSEAAAAESDLCVDPGDQLMEYFLRGGLARIRPAVAAPRPLIRSIDSPHPAMSDPPDPSLPNKNAPDERTIPLEPVAPTPLPPRPVAPRSSLLNAPADDKCPHCGAKMSPDAIVCMACGFDMKANEVLTSRTGVDVVEPPPERPEFIKPGGTPTTLAIAGVCVTLAATVAAAATAPHGSGFTVGAALVLLVLYRVIAHTGTGVLGLWCAARFVDSRLTRLPLAAARMFLAMSIYLLVASVHLPLGNPYLESALRLPLAIVVYWLALFVLFRRSRQETFLILLFHFGFYMFVEVGVYLVAALEAAVAASPAH